MNCRPAILVLAVVLFPGVIGCDFAQAAGRRAGTGGVPNLDVRPSCRESTISDCLTMEQTAREALIKEWPSYSAQDKARCATEAQYSGPPSYVEWLTCLEINAHVRNTPLDSGTGSDTSSAMHGGTSAAHRSRRLSMHRHVPGPQQLIVYHSCNDSSVSWIVGACPLCVPFWALATEDRYCVKDR